MWYKAQHRMSEQEIIQGCISEDRNCQFRLYKQYAGKMMVVCMRYCKNKEEAEDVLQEGFIKVFDNISKFKNAGSFEGWIRRIMVNVALNRIRGNRMIFEGIEQRAELVETDTGNALDKMSEVELLNIISKLPEGYKFVFNMYAIEGYSHKEIAEKLGIEEVTSRSQYMKAKKYLQQQIQLLEKRTV